MATDDQRPASRGKTPIVRETFDLPGTPEGSGPGLPLPAPASTSDSQLRATAESQDDGGLLSVHAEPPDESLLQARQQSADLLRTALATGQLERHVGGVHDREADEHGAAASSDRAAIEFEARQQVAESLRNALATGELKEVVDGVCARQGVGAEMEETREAPQSPAGAAEKKKQAKEKKPRKERQPLEPPLDDDEREERHKFIEKARTTFGHGRFRRPGRSRPAQYVWVPKRIPLGQDLVERVIKHWKLQRPNLLLRLSSGFSHPLHLYDVEALDGAFGCGHDPRFEELLRTVQLEGVAEINEAGKQKKELKMINKILKRAVFKVLQTIVQVAAQQNLWIVVMGRPSGITLLLEEALASVPHVVVLVVDCPFRRENMDLQRKVDFYSKQLGSIPDAEKEEREQWMRKAIELTNNDIAYMNYILMKNKYSLEHPGDSFDLNWDFWKGMEKAGWAQQSSTHLEAEEIRWNQYIFRSGTHYLLFDRETPADFDLDLFGPKGCVFMGGGDETKKNIMESMRLGQPTVLLHHTARATQQLVILHEKLMKHFKGDDETVENERELDRLKDLCEAVGATQNDKYKCGAKGAKASTLNYADIVTLNQLYKQRNQIIGQTCVAIDPLDPNTTEKNVLFTVSDCFAANYRISTNVAYEASSRRAIIFAWQMHAQLSCSCEYQKIMMDFSLISVLILGFIALCVSTAVMEIDKSGLLAFGITKDDGFYEFLQYLVIIIPALSGLINTLSSRMRFKETWGLMKSAAATIEAEIFKFRVRVREYAVVGTAGANASGGRGDRQLREKQVRDCFNEKVHQIFQDHLTDIGGASLKPALPITSIPLYAECATVLSLDHQGGFHNESHQNWARKQSDTANLKQFEEEQLSDDEEEQHKPFSTTQSTLASTSEEQVPLKAAAEEPAAVQEPGTPRLSTTSGVGMLPGEANRGSPEAKVLADPSMGNLSAQNYYKIRTLPTLGIMLSEARRLQRWVTAGEVIIATSAVLGSILGALARGTEGATVGLVPVCVSVGASVTSIMHQNALYARLTSANAAVRALSKLDLEWSASSPLEQCSLSKITELVEETEYARLNFMTSWTTVVRGSKKRTSQQKADAQKQQV